MSTHKSKEKPEAETIGNPEAETIEKELVEGFSYPQNLGIRRAGRSQKVILPANDQLSLEEKEKTGDKNPK